MRGIGTSAILVAALVGITSWAVAHDFWLVAVGDEIHGISGSDGFVVRADDPHARDHRAPVRVGELLGLHHVPGSR